MNSIVNSVIRLGRTMTTPWTQLMLQILALSPSVMLAGWPADYQIRDGDKFDFIVVGAGSAGAIVAARLSEISYWKVLLIEAGGDPPAASVLPSTFATLAHTPTDWDYKALFDRGVGQAHPGGIQFMTRGKMLGGSSSNNYEIYCRGVPQDYNEWNAPGWDWDNVLPYFKKLEGMTDPTVFENPQNVYRHSKNGPVLVSRRTPNTYFQEKNEMFLNALRELGIKTVLENNGPDIYGASLPHFTFANGRRSSTAEAYLRTTKDKSNLFVAKFVRATKILIDSVTNEAYGVKVYLKSGKKASVYASKEVIISAGSIDSPKLLMLSGIGPREELEKFKIDVLADLPVGKNYHDHQVVGLTFTGERGLVSAAQNLFTFTELEAYPVPIQSGFFKLNNSGSFEHKPEYQVFNIHTGAAVAPMVFATCQHAVNFDEPYCFSLARANLLNELDQTQLVMMHPKSRGQVKLRSRNAYDDPVIELGYYRDEEDVRTMVEGAKFLSRIANTSYFRKVKGNIVKADVTGCRGLKWGSDDHWACFVKNTVISLLHPVGTCAMGPQGVVNQDLKVHGVKKLRVVDASIMPKIPSGNTNAPTMMIGEKAADMIKAEYLSHDHDE